MDTTDTTQADTGTDTATPTADTDGAVEFLRLMPPTAWEAMLIAGKIATDPKAFRRALRALHDAAVTTTAAQDAREKQLDAREAAVAEYEKTSRAEIEQQRKTTGQIWEGAKARESAVEEREERCREREHELGWDYTPPSGFQHIEGTTIRQEPPPPVRRTVRVGNTGEPFPDATTITREAEEPAGARVRGRPHA
jgi:hypothetical protein